MKPKIVIIISDTIQALGLEHLLYSTFQAQIISIKTLEALSPAIMIEDFDLIVTSEHDFLKNVSFFIANRSKTITITTDNVISPSHNSIGTRCDKSDIIDFFDHYLKQPVTQPVNTNLSKRETEVLKCVAMGLINKQIAEKLNISINTVLTHRKNIIAKTGIKSASGLSIYALMNGIVSTKDTP